MPRDRYNLPRGIREAVPFQAVDPATYESGDSTGHKSRDSGGHKSGDSSGLFWGEITGWSSLGCGLGAYDSREGHFAGASHGSRMALYSLSNGKRL